MTDNCLDNDYSTSNFFLTTKYFLETDVQNNKDIISLFDETSKLFKYSCLDNEKKDDKKNNVKDEIKKLEKTIKVNDKAKKINAPLIQNAFKSEAQNVDNENNNIKKNKLESDLLILNNNYDLMKKQQIYQFGILPIDTMPSSYIPLNYKNYSRNLNRIARNDIFTHEDYTKIFEDFDKSSINSFKNKIQTTLENILKDFNREDSLYNKFKLNVFSIHLIIIWSIVIITLMSILFYYYPQINYILAFIVISYLIVAIIWKMIYTIQN